jgi:hypothetical protein
LSKAFTDIAIDSDRGIVWVILIAISQCRLKDLSEATHKNLGAKIPVIWIKSSGRLI